MNKFGFNVMKVDDRLLNWLATKKTPVVTLISGGIMDRADDAQRILDAAPDTVLIYRAWMMPNGFRMDMNYPINGISVDQFFQFHQPLIDRFGDKIVYHAWNEANRPSNIAEYYNWAAESELVAQNRGLRLCHASFGTGSPDLPYYDTPEAIRFYRSLADGSFRSLLGFHEYVPGNEDWETGITFHIGRYRRMVDEMVTAGIDPRSGTGLKCVFTELGTEGVNKSMNEFGRDEAWVSDQIVTMHEELYDDDPNVLGTCWFCYGDSGGWSNHDLTATGLLDYLYTQTTPNEGEPPVTICDQPLPELNESQAGTRWECTIDSLNVRAYPAVDACAAPVGSLGLGDRVMIKGTMFVNNYTWLVIETGNPAPLYCALGDQQEETYYMKLVEDPGEEDYAIVLMTNDVSSLPVIQYLAQHSGGAIKLSPELFEAIEAAQTQQSE